MRPWQEYVAEAEMALEAARQEDHQAHTEVARTHREEATVLSTLAVVAALVQED